MIENFQDYAKSVKPALDEAFTGQLARLLGDGETLRSPGGPDLLGGGKKIRGSLLCLVTEALGGTVDDALPRAVAVELIHTATLIHDDYVDQHRSRRDLAATWTLEGSRKAVLLGDVVFASAIQMMSEMGREDGLTVSRAIADVARGAYREPLSPASLLEEIEKGGVDPALYEKIIYLKTGVLFAAACQLGAVAAGVDGDIRGIWRSYGRKIGEAYQIADDLHEFERCLGSHSISLDDITALAPALLCFVGKSGPAVIEALRRGAAVSAGELLDQFHTAVEAMRADLENRLLSAIEGLKRDCRNTDFYRLACRTPRDLIRMFDDTATRASAP